ncbi:MAG TPA: hypothetical protein VEX62_05775 [Candidatus Limnocylindrales bacterium]|nr:hypothetical protein [Candidatus Limnocylindrales bacterium]
MTLRPLAALLLGAGLVTGCGSAAPAASVEPSAVPTIEATSTPTATATPTAPPTPAVTIPTLTLEDQDLEAGTYRLNSIVRPEFPPILFTVPDGWSAGGSFLFGAGDTAVGFWNVSQLYGHPCQWGGTLSDPGPTVDDMVQALVDVPLRDASEPIDVTLDGYAGKYVEWSVPTDIEWNEQDGFVDCDADGGEHYFESWTGSGMGSDRYHQGPGQVDRLWILDVDGSRLVINATDMPLTTSADRQELLEVVESIRFEG